MAPGADIDVYENPETLAGEVAEIAAMVDEDRDQIITSSYGQPCEQEEQAGQAGTQQAQNFLFQQAAAQGQTFLGAAGDNGSDSLRRSAPRNLPQPGQNPISTGELASQPYVLGVGGTTITDAASQPAQEHVWNDGPEGGAGGGGISQAFAMPSWQREATVPGIALPGSADYTNAASVEQRFGYPSGFCDSTLPGAEATTPCRLVPDVVRPSGRVHGRGDRLQRGVPGRRRRTGARWMDHDGRHLLGQPDLGRDARARRRLADLPRRTRRRPPGSGSSARCCTRSPPNPAPTRRRSTTSPKATTTSLRPRRRQGVPGHGPATTWPRASARRG